MDGIEQELARSAGGLEHFFVVERLRLLYVRVPKAACSTMLWGLLEWAGHDPSIMDGSLNPLLSTPGEVVQDRDLYPVPTLADVNPPLRHDALTGSDWMRLAVVRNPYSRLYSAWESKVLLRPPANKKFAKSPDLVQGERGIDVGASFRSFVSALSESPEGWLSERHFCPQVDLVPTAVIDGIKVVPTTGITDLFARLSERAGVKVTPRRSNEGLGINGTSLLDADTAKKIATLYAADFELTGIDPDDVTPGEPVYLDTLAQGLLRLAADRSRRTVQLSHAYAKTREPPSRVRRATRRLSRNLADRENGAPGPRHRL